MRTSAAPSPRLRAARDFPSWPPMSGCKAGIVLALECSRLARSNADWYQLLGLHALTDTLIAQVHGIYHPGSYNDRLIRGLKWTVPAYAAARAGSIDTDVMHGIR